MKKLIEEIKQEIRDLRDSYFHFCADDIVEDKGKTKEERIEWFSKWLDKNASDDNYKCTCGEFDSIIDKLERIKNGR